MFQAQILTEELALGLGSLLCRLLILKKDSKSFSFFRWFILAVATVLSRASAATLSHASFSFACTLALFLASATALSALSFASVAAISRASACAL